MIYSKVIYAKMWYISNDGDYMKNSYWSESFGPGDLGIVTECLSRQVMAIVSCGCMSQPSDPEHRDIHLGL